jgi:hypothetical protein
MSVWKEDAMMLEGLEKFQEQLEIGCDRNSAFYGPFGMARGFNLKSLTSDQARAVHNLRAWCKDNIEYAEVTDDRPRGGSWKFRHILDEGAYGWNVLVELRETSLGLNIKPFTRYEA